MRKFGTCLVGLRLGRFTDRICQLIVHLKTALSQKKHNLITCKCVLFHHDNVQFHIAKLMVVYNFISWISFQLFRNVLLIMLGTFFKKKGDLEIILWKIFSSKKEKRKRRETFDGRY